MKVRDPKGNELKMLLLQVLDSDEQGPLMMRVLRDHERVDLDNEKHRKFLIVWSPVDSALGEMRLDDLHADLELVKTELAKHRAESADIGRALKSAQRELAAMEEGNRTKTEALRQLQKERDPERIEALVVERVRTQTVTLDQVIANLRGQLADNAREIEELRASKKKLREALERQKAQR